MTCHETVPIDHGSLHSEIVAAMPNQLVQFLEATFIEQQFDPLAGGKLAFAMLLCFPFSASTLFGSRVPSPDLF